MILIERQKNVSIIIRTIMHFVFGKLFEKQAKVTETNVQRKK